MPRTLVIGLDSVPASLALEAWRDRLPNLAALAAQGSAGVLRSTDPPITVPAWASMMTGVDPGGLGLYGFQDRADRSYHRRALATSSRVGAPAVWDRAAAAGLRSIVLGVPPSYPPRPREGVVQVCDFLAPGTDADYTWPAELAREIEAEIGEYGLDVTAYRAPDKLRIAQDCRRITEQHFALARHLMRTRPWDLFVLVEIGTDRLQHAILSAMDPTHPRHVPGGTLERVALEYFQLVDRRVGELVELAGDEASVLVVSDHGARPLRGGLRLNEWLRREGYLVLTEAPGAEAPFRAEAVDWGRTRAWADGGYVGRVYLNVRGREPRGCVPAAGADALLGEIAAGLAALMPPGEETRPNRVLRPEERFAVCRGVPPDLWVYPGDLDWRALGSMGTGPLWSPTNDTGPDDANHDFAGTFVLRRADAARCRLPSDWGIPDVAPTLLHELGLAGSEQLAGRSLATHGLEPGR